MTLSLCFLFSPKIMQTFALNFNKNITKQNLECRFALFQVIMSLSLLPLTNRQLRFKLSTLYSNSSLIDSLLFFSLPFLLLWHIYISTSFSSLLFSSLLLVSSLCALILYLFSSVYLSYLCPLLIFLSQVCYFSPFRCSVKAL